MRCFVAASYAEAIRKSVGSEKGLPKNIIPTGSFAGTGPTSRAPSRAVASRTLSNTWVGTLSVRFFIYRRAPLEQRLTMMAALQHNFGLEEARAKRIVSDLKMFRPYGKIGPLPWQSPSGPAFGESAAGADLLAVSKNILTFSEGITDAVRVQIQSALEIVARSRISRIWVSQPKHECASCANRGSLAAHICYSVLGCRRRITAT
jgi:hypothetical protein